MCAAETKMSQSSIVYKVGVIVIGFMVAHVCAWPLEETATEAATVANVSTIQSVPAKENTTNVPAPTQSNTEKPSAVSNQQQSGTADLEPAATDNKPQTYVDAAGNPVSANNFDAAAAASAMYGGLISPEALQQYVSQFGAAYAPYAAYPAPLGYAGVPPPPPGPIYPGPYVVQTGYEGYLVPATTTEHAATGSSPTAASATQGGHLSTALLNPLDFIKNLLPAYMLPTLFKLVIAAVTAIFMIFFGGAITTAICNLTPLCDITFTTISYLRSDDNAERVGRMIAEGITPERVRRASEIVRQAIRKYRALQELTNEEKESY